MEINPQIISLLMDLRRRGIADTKLLSAFEKIPRDLFIPDAFSEQAYEDLPCPIGADQIMMPPYVVAQMISLLEVTDRCKVLEIGTGTGYASALLSKLARRVYTIELNEDLLTLADQRFKELDLHTISSKRGDGMKGWEAQAPFDRIVVHGALTVVPELLMDQLGDHGIMVTALGDGEFDQKLTKIEKDMSKPQDDQVKVSRLQAVKFSPLIVQEAFAQEAENRV